MPERRKPIKTLIYGEAHSFPLRGLRREAYVDAIESSDVLAIEQFGHTRTFRRMAQQIADGRADVYRPSVLDDQQQDRTDRWEIIYGSKLRIIAPDIPYQQHFAYNREFFDLQEQIQLMGMFVLAGQSDRNFSNVVSSWRSILTQEADLTAQREGIIAENINAQMSLLRRTNRIPQDPNLLVEVGGAHVDGLAQELNTRFPEEYDISKTYERPFVLGFWDETMTSIRMRKELAPSELDLSVARSIAETVLTGLLIEKGFVPQGEEGKEQSHRLTLFMREVISNYSYEDLGRLLTFPTQDFELNKRMLLNSVNAVAYGNFMQGEEHRGQNIAATFPEIMAVLQQ